MYWHRAVLLNVPDIWPLVPQERNTDPPSCSGVRVCGPCMAIAIDRNTGMTATAAAVAAVMISCALSFGLRGTSAAWLQKAPLLLLAVTIVLDVLQAMTMQAKVKTCLSLVTSSSSSLSKLATHSVS